LLIKNSAKYEDYVIETLCI